MVSKDRALQFYISKISRHQEIFFNSALEGILGLKFAKAGLSFLLTMQK
jgi:hypothetical protein